MLSKPCFCKHLSRCRKHQDGRVDKSTLILGAGGPPYPLKMSWGQEEGDAQICGGGVGETTGSLQPETMFVCRRSFLEQLEFMKSNELRHSPGQSPNSRKWAMTWVFHCIGNCTCLVLFVYAIEGPAIEQKASQPQCRSIEIVSGKHHHNLVQLIPAREWPSQVLTLDEMCKLLISLSLGHEIPLKLETLRVPNLLSSEA